MAVARATEPEIRSTKFLKSTWIGLRYLFYCSLRDCLVPKSIALASKNDTFVCENNQEYTHSLEGILQFTDLMATCTK